MIICGIDEAGRGCIAGSLFVCGVVLKCDIAELKDSKKLSQKQRFSLLDIIKENSKFHLVKKDSKEIDKYGLSKCIRESLLEIIDNLCADRYIFDGNCNFKINMLETLIKGDNKLQPISAASIVAKCSKDSEMIEISQKYPQYNFHNNKGYVTKEHIESIEKYGLCEIHRTSYHIKSLDKSIFNLG